MDYTIVLSTVNCTLHLNFRLHIPFERLVGGSIHWTTFWELIKFWLYWPSERDPSANNYRFGFSIEFCIPYSPWCWGKHDSILTKHCFLSSPLASNYEQSHLPTQHAVLWRNRDQIRILRWKWHQVTLFAMIGLESRGRFAYCCLQIQGKPAARSRDLAHFLGWLEQNKVECYTNIPSTQWYVISS